MPLAVGGGVDPVRALAVGALVAVLATAYESVSVHGLDNLLVPFGTMLFLDRYLDARRGSSSALQALLIVAICAGTAALRWRRPATGGGFAAFVAGGLHGARARWLDLDAAAGRASSRPSPRTSD